MPSIANTNRDRKLEARIDAPGPYKPLRTHGPILTSGLPYIEPELTGEWPFCSCDQIMAEYRKPGVDASLRKVVAA